MCKKFVCKICVLETIRFIDPIKVYETKEEFLTHLIDNHNLLIERLTGVNLKEVLK